MLANLGDTYTKCNILLETGCQKGKIHQICKRVSNNIIELYFISEKNLHLTSGSLKRKEKNLWELPPTFVISSWLFQESLRCFGTKRYQTLSCCQQLKEWQKNVKTGRDSFSSPDLFPCRPKKIQKTGATVPFNIQCCPAWLSRLSWKSLYLLEAVRTPPPPPWPRWLSWLSTNTTACSPSAIPQP